MYSLKDGVCNMDTTWNVIQRQCIQLLSKSYVINDWQWFIVKCNKLGKCFTYFSLPRVIVNQFFPCPWQLLLQCQLLQTIAGVASDYHARVCFLDVWFDCLCSSNFSYLLLIFSQSTAFTPLCLGLPHWFCSSSKITDIMWTPPPLFIIILLVFSLQFTSLTLNYCLLSLLFCMVSCSHGPLYTSGCGTGYI